MCLHPYTYDWKYAGPLNTVGPSASQRSKLCEVETGDTMEMRRKRDKKEVNRGSELRRCERGRERQLDSGQLGSTDKSYCHCISHFVTSPPLPTSPTPCHHTHTHHIPLSSRLFPLPHTHTLIPLPRPSLTPQVVVKSSAWGLSGSSRGWVSGWP